MNGLKCLRCLQHLHHSTSSMEALLLQSLRPHVTSLPASQTASRTHTHIQSHVHLTMQDGLYYTAIGSQLDCSGSAMLYSSSDYATWGYAGLLASQTGVEPSAECTPAANGESCNQFGATCRSWECPDFFSVPGVAGVYALKWSDQVGGDCCCTSSCVYRANIQ